MAASAPKLRALYRSFLREMPTRTPSLLANPSPLQKHIRTDIATTSSPSSPSLAQQLQTKSAEARAQEAEQYLQFIQQQRLYSTLVERYNPGADMTEEERVRLTARRVGMELPVEAMGGKEE
jgi:ATP synthase assembly factor FMC1